MENKLLDKNKIYIQVTDLGKFLIQSSGYTEFYEKILENNIDYDDKKTYEIAVSGFVDFNQHLYEDINHMNSISSGIYLENSLITYRIFIWGSKGEGFEIFKHVLLGEEIKNLNNEEDIKEYIYILLSELESGILKTYEKDNIQNSFEQFGRDIESRKLPLQNILQSLSLQNNIYDFS